MTIDAADRRLATFGGLVAILLWSTTVAFARRLAESLGPATAAAAVYTVGGVVALGALVPSSRARQRLRGLPLRYLVGCGALFVAYALLLFLAIGGARTREQVLVVGLVNYLWPVLTIALSVPLLGRRPGRLLGPGVTLAVAGTVLVLIPGGPGSWWGFVRADLGPPQPYALAALAALCWAFYSNLTTRWVGGRAQGGVVVFLAATAVVLGLVAALVDEPRRWAPAVALETGYLGLATWAAYGLWDRAMRQGDTALVVAASFLTPFLSTVAAGLLLTVAPGVEVWFGCLLLVAGSVLCRRAVGG